MWRRLILLMPLILFLGLCILLWRGLTLDPQKIPSPLIDKIMPSLNLNNLNRTEKALTESDLDGHVSLLNVWATWCVTCEAEHAWLLSAKKRGLRIFGLDYKDDDQKAKGWLNELGDPYVKVGVDHEGLTAIDWGVYGTPETFIIDKHRVIRYKHIGAIDQQVLAEVIYPLVRKLELEK